MNIIKQLEHLKICAGSWVSESTETFHYGQSEAYNTALTLLKNLKVHIVMDCKACDDIEVNSIYFSIEDAEAFIKAEGYPTDQQGYPRYYIIGSEVQ